MMKKYKNILIILSSILLIACSSPDTYDIDGGAIRLSDYKGQWIVVNYWADWCAPCITEMPELSELQRQYPDQLKVFGVNYDQMLEDRQQEFAAQLDINFTLLMGFPADKYGFDAIIALPVTYIIDPNGQLVKKLAGEQTIQSILAAMDIVE